MGTVMEFAGGLRQGKVGYVPLSLTSTTTTVSSFGEAVSNVESLSLDIRFKWVEAIFRIDVAYRPWVVHVRV